MKRGFLKKILKWCPQMDFWRREERKSRKGKIKSPRIKEIINAHHKINEVIDGRRLR
jgi:hypothetical protein